MLTGRPKISVITAVRNGVSTIERTIQSVLAQSYRNIQYIVIDGGSTDGTIDVINQYASQIDCWVSEADRGIYDGFNKGIDRAEGKYVCILNADDFFSPDAVERLVEQIPLEVTADRLPIIHANMSLIMASGRPIAEYHHRGNAFRKRFSAMPVNHPATFVPLVVYQKIGKFDASFRIAGDYEFILRALNSGVKFIYIDETLVYMQTGGASSLRNAYVLSHERFVARVRNGGSLLAASFRLLLDYLTYSLRKIKRLLVPSKYDSA